jgi:ribonuclease D
VIGTQEQLARFLPQLETGDWVAVDTEADSLHAYPEKLCLIQLSVPAGDFLLDPLAGLDCEPLFRALHSRELVMHGADYDLRLFNRAYGFVPAAVFDTMWAARLLGYRQFGLSDLVQQRLGVRLEKGPQKMNWALRPLPERMTAYALNDTRYLAPLAEMLRGELREKGRLAWLQEVCVRVIQEAAKPRELDPDTVWRVKGSDRLSPAAMAVVRELWNWREQEALTVNKPPYFVLSHETLIALSDAASHGRPAHELIPRYVPTRRAARLKDAIERGLQVPPGEHPRPRRSTGVRLTQNQLNRFDELKRTRDARAESLALDPTLVASKADLVGLAKDPRNGAELMSWQRVLLGLG